MAHILAYIALADGASPVIRCARTLCESFKGFPSKLNSSVVLAKAEICQTCKVSVCDLKSVYLQCELDHSSSLLTIFRTPFGRYR